MVFIVFALFLLNSCATKIEPLKAPIEEPIPFSQTGNDSIPEKWWIIFEDSVLNRLIDSALSENLNLRAVWQQFQAANAVVDRETSSLFPQIGAFAEGGTSSADRDFDREEDIILGLSASYEIDLWGRVRAGIKAEQFRAKASFYDYQAAAMSLSARIANTWYELLAARKQLELAKEQIQTNKNLVELIRARFVGGQIRAVDILRQEQLLESTRRQKIQYQINLGLLKNQLAILLGEPPQNPFSLPETQLPELPPLPETGLPFELVRRRPDVQRAYNFVLAADREMAQAIRSKYPRLSVDFIAETGLNSSASLFQDWAYSLVGNLVAPLFYGGRLGAEVNRTEAIKNQLLYEYGQTVLNAFREVEDALLLEKKQKQRIEVLKNQLELAQKTSKQLKREFLNGLSDYLDVLLSLEDQQRLQRELIAAEQRLLEIRIALYRALAGGFETERTDAN